jgi:hypothetical protein
LRKGSGSWKQIDEKVEVEVKVKVEVKVDFLKQ